MTIEEKLNIPVCLFHIISTVITGTFHKCPIKLKVDSRARRKRSRRVYVYLRVLAYACVLARACVYACVCVCVSLDAHGISYLTDEDIYDEPRDAHISPRVVLPCVYMHNAHAHSMSFSSNPSFFIHSRISPLRGCAIIAK